MLRVCVTDTGVGIPSSKLSNLFEPFIQAESSTTRRFGGTGLGLAICKRLLAGMGGSINVTSEIGKGSEFSFLCPFTVSSVVVAKEDSHEARRILAGLKILIVDDNDTNRLIFREQLSVWQCTVHEACNAGEALRRMFQEHETGAPYQLVLLDFAMPVADGAGFAMRVNASEELKNTPLILVTSVTEAHIARSLLDQSGFRAVLTKPIRKSRLYQTIVDVLKIEVTRNTKQKDADIHPLMTVAPEERARRRVLLVEDNAVNQRVGVMMLERAGLKCEVAGNGQEALDMLDLGAFDLVLMDYHMPVMDGLTAASIIRERERTSGAHIPIVAMTAGALKEDMDRCFAVGMDRYLSKPVKKESLFTAIFECLYPGLVRNSSRS
jgi:CheY-like chemotaxis protein